MSPPYSWSRIELNEFQINFHRILEYFLPFRINRIANFRIESNKFRTDSNLTPPLGTISLFGFWMVVRYEFLTMINHKQFNWLLHSLCVVDETAESLNSYTSLFLVPSQFSTVVCMYNCTLPQLSTYLVLLYIYLYSRPSTFIICPFSKSLCRK